MPKYKVNWPIKGLLKKGATLQFGDVIELDETRASRCVETGSLSVIAEPLPPNDPVDFAAQAKAQLPDDTRPGAKNQPNKKRFGR